MSAGGQVHSVIVIGAGMSGICMGIKLRERGIDDFVILEKSAGVGGTWYDNTYPGACCDVASVLYSYSFEPNPDWSRKYSPHDEIQAYFAHCVEKYELDSRLRVNTAVEEAVFDEAAGLWRVRTAAGETLSARALVSGLGQLNKPFIPAFPGAGRFQGESFHSARWNHEIDLAGKRVAVIGNAASALQFIPHVAREASRLYVYQRSANYVIPRNDHAYSDVQKKRFARWPWLQKLHRLSVFVRGEIFYYFILRNNRLLSPLFERWTRSYLEKQVSDPDLRAALTPDYPMGCKRILVSDDYYQAFERDGAELVCSPVSGFNEQGVMTEDGIERPVDVVIYGTGFQASKFLAGLDVSGSGGRSLKEAWAEGAQAYRGVCVAGFPNFFLLYGPNTNLGSNSIIFMVEQQVSYAVDCITKLLGHDLKVLDVRADVMAAYNRHIQAELDKTVWVASCDSWYKNAAGKVVNNWPGSTPAYWWQMRAPEFADFEMRS